MYVDRQLAKRDLSNTDPEYALDLEVKTEGVRSIPQVLIDVFYADGISRPLPFEVRHVLTSRPAIAEADRAVAQAVEELTKTLQAHPAPVHISYDEGKLQLSVIPAGSGSAIPGAAQQYQRLQQRAVRLSSALSAMRKAAPGLRFAVTVVPSPAQGARTFSWRLTPRPDVGSLNRAQGLKEQEPSRGKVAATRSMATPLQVASAHGAATIMDAAATVAQQAAAIAAAVTTTAAPLIQLELEAGRRLVAVTPPASFLMAAAAATAAQRTARHGGVLRSLSLTRGADASDVSGGGAAAVSKGIAAADEAAAVLRRALSSANHALFRLAKRGAAGASAGKDAAALRKGDPSAYPIAQAVTLVFEAALDATRHAAATAAMSEAAAAPMPPPPRPPSGDGGGIGGSIDGLSVSELISVEPQLRSASESGSMLSSSVNAGGAYCGSTAGGCASNCEPPSPLLSKGYGSGTSADGLNPGGSWSWDWGIEPRVPGVSFPDCLSPKVRAVYDAVNRVVDTARAVTEELPRVQREVLVLVDESEAVFRKNEEQLHIMAHDMMSAGRAEKIERHRVLVCWENLLPHIKRGFAVLLYHAVLCRLRAALDRNANTISASPTLVDQVRAAVTRLMSELRRGAEQMREMVAQREVGPGGDVSADDMRECCDSSRRGSGSGSRSIMARQLNKAAAVMATAALAPVAAGVEEGEEEVQLPDAGSEIESVSVLPSTLSTGGNNAGGDTASKCRDLATGNTDVEYNGRVDSGVNDGGTDHNVSGDRAAVPADVRARRPDDAGSKPASHLQEGGCCDLPNDRMDDVVAKLRQVPPAS
ncbi:hypothetical protein VOLCADRAFT_98498 [Volvox carteri f. nagariensis]|uniref:Uncharacterized protein n=1 Tax=Volvox carteri f. nagariensis TaxID=3068 RepID=D8UFH9_VOLCA|nr:uncharacterized protein VOLCADRAFT_98498 [Volvox carteri f. nagariensis]EFJ41505.1 hypothetical protein VOLCADRAFT_98498 [Volvox carteri f. nagariensis]|eukprot:XP_002957450.1 hypothetical protein VOLCADRAFT_98498 [Volvox carteri f. nagariensis]